MSPDLNRIEVTSAQDLWDWLEIHHADSQSYLLVTWKASCPEKYVSRVAEAQEKGTWLVNEDVDQLICPDDLMQVLMTHHAYDWWQASAPSYRRNILRWLGSAKQPQTRDKRIEQIKTASMAGEKMKNM